MIEILAQDNGGSRWWAPDQASAGELRWQWMNLPESWGVFVWLVLIIAVIAGVWTLYRRENPACPPGIRGLLAVMRTCVWLLLLLMLWKPSVFFQQVSVLKPTFALLRDGSLSLDRSDRYSDPQVVEQLAQTAQVPRQDLEQRIVKRVDLVNRSLANPTLGFVDAVRDKGQVQIIDFADRWNPAALLPARTETPSESPPPSESASSAEANWEPLQATGLNTDLWSALRQTLSDTQRLAGIILISDGQHQGAEDPVEIAKRAKAADIPIFVVGVGDPVPERNLSVTDALSPARGYRNEPMFLEGILQVNLAADDPARQTPVDVSLVQQMIDPQTGRPGEAQVLETKPVVLPEGNNRVRVPFTCVIDQPGNYRFTIAAQEIANETVTTDNQKASGNVEVVDEKIRVLIISGLPNWDFQQVSRLLQRDGTISVSCWLQSMDETRLQEGNVPITDLPRTREELSQFNAVIMIDPNPEEFDESWVNLLQDFCRNRGGGLLYMAGPHYSSEFLTMNRLASFRELLPVRLGDATTIAASQVIAEATGERTGGMQIVNYNLEHQIMKLAEDAAEVQRIWSQMPGFLWNFPTLAPKPTARVLLERGDQPGMEGNQPMLVDGKFGSGTVLYFGFQGTWRWRSVGLQAQYFNNFWIQTVRYLIENRSLQGNRRGYVDADRLEYELGDRVLLVADVVNEQYQPLAAESLPVSIRDEDGRAQVLTMRPVPTQAGKYEVTWNAARVGNYQVSLQPDNAENASMFEPTRFRVTPPRAELNATWLNEKLLKDIAEQSGGKYFSLQDLGQLPQHLPELATRAEFNTPPQPVWDLNSWWRILFFLIPVALLTSEWALRKWYRLL